MEGGGIGINQTGDELTIDSSSTDAIFGNYAFTVGGTIQVPDSTPSGDKTGIMRIEVAYE